MVKEDRLFWAAMVLCYGLIAYAFVELCIH